jgi:transcription elongation factor Elf1
MKATAIKELFQPMEIATNCPYCNKDHGVFCKSKIHKWAAENAYTLTFCSVGFVLNIIVTVIVALVFR